MHVKTEKPCMTENSPPKTGKKRKCCPRMKPKGERGFLEGCLFALCCCWICDICFDTTVVMG